MTMEGRRPQVGLSGLQDTIGAGPLHYSYASCSTSASLVCGDCRSADVCLPFGLGAEDHSHIVQQLDCTEEVAIKDQCEMNILLVRDELQCSRA